MEKRVLLAVFLSFLVLFVYQSVFAPPPPKPPAGNESPATAASGGQPAKATPASAAGQNAPKPPAPAAAPAAAPQPAPETLTADTEPRTIVVETDDVRAEFSNQGGDLRSWRLKHFLDREGQPLELVPTDVPPDEGHPFDLRLDNDALTSQLSQALFKPSADRLDLRGGKAGTLAFEYRDAAGLYARKTFQFDPAKSPFLIDFSSTVENGGQTLNPAIVWGPAVGSGLNASGRGFYALPDPLYYLDGKVTRVKTKNLASTPTYTGAFPYAGVEDHYFLAVEVDPTNAAAGVAARPKEVDFRLLELPPPDGGKTKRQLIVFSLKFAEGPADGRFFFGPKDFDILQSVEPGLVKAINFGFFAWLAVPLLRALKWLDGFVHNYGWSIVFLTILINIVIGPLRHKSVVSMRKMQEIQPEVKAIQERYKKLKTTDPAKQKMNTELMNLYRERGVNPASGCIPMLLTIPILFAFYSLLSVAIELRGAPFFAWIHDLSAPDPLYITPVLMGITQVVQQKMTPSSADPMQQKMMMFMPIMFTVMFLWAPSGLVLYWFTSNLCAIGQQQVTNTIIGPPKVHQVRPAAERKVKRAGSGKTEQAAKG